MFPLFKKEIAGFFSSLTGYVVVIVFLVANSLVMWVMPGQWNVLDSGYAGLDTLFVLSPWFFLFLVPAVTMRMVAEEKRNGTLELLCSRPIGEGAVIYGKFLASVTLVIISLLPALVFAVSVWLLGETPGNLDRGGTAGSFIGLVLLATVYSAIGLFSSALTGNQVVAFIVAVVLSFTVYAGFDSLSALPWLGSAGEFVSRIGLNEHYRSVSRGVIDIRDVAWFAFVTVFFTEAARLALRRGSWRKSLSVTAVAAMAAVALSFLHVRADLTEDRRYTLSKPTRTILGSLEKEIEIDVYLDGEMPVAFKKLRRTAEQYLDEFRIASGRKLSYRFINPYGSKDAATRERFQSDLISRGLMPVNVMASDGEGGKSQKMIFPSMEVRAGKTVIPVNFLRNNPSLPAETNLLHSAEGLEYEIVQAVATAASDSVPRIAFIEGHGEYDELSVADITLELAKYYNIDRGVIGGRPGIIDRYAALIVADPQKAVDEKDKFILDQYVMNGGRVLWLADEVKVRSDSLVEGSTVALYEPLSFSDMLFRYGARINPYVVADMECMIIPLKVSVAGGQPQYMPAQWVYFPLLRPSPLHPVTRSLNRIRSEFPNYIDTVGRDGRVSKTVLLTTSPASRAVAPPAVISLDEARNAPDAKLFGAGELPVAVLLEGTFTSAFKNRMTESIAGDAGKKILQESRNTRMIVVADPDIIRNDVSWRGGEPEPLALGLDRYTQQTFGNKDFIVNCINFLVDDNGLISLRSREIKPRLLDQSAVRKNRTFWQLINTVAPVLVIILAGILYNKLRERRFN